MFVYFNEKDYLPFPFLATFLIPFCFCNPFPHHRTLNPNSHCRSYIQAAITNLVGRLPLPFLEAGYHFHSCKQATIAIPASRLLLTFQQAGCYSRSAGRLLLPFLYQISIPIPMSVPMPMTVLVTQAHLQSQQA
jgi:hypothetical protein